MDFDKYKTNIPLPKKEDFTTWYYYKDGKLVFTDEASKGVLTLVNIPEHGAREAVLDRAGYQQALQKRSKTIKGVEAQFWIDAEEELGIPPDHPKIAKMRSYAWEKGHAYGYSDIFNHYVEIWDVVGGD